MFSITLSGQSLDLAPGQEIVLTRISSYFAKELEYDGSELISLALSPRNMLLLGFPTVLEVDLTQEFAVLLHLNQNTHLATLRLQSVSDTISAYLLYNRKQLTCFEKNCRDFNWEVDHPGANSAAKLLAQFKKGTEEFWPTTPFYFPTIQNLYFYDDPDADSPINPFFEGLINQSTYGSTQFLPVQNFIDGITLDVTNRNTLVPMLPVLEILKRGFLSDGYRITGQLLLAPWAPKVFLYNSQSLDVVADATAATSVVATQLLDQPIVFSGQKVLFQATSQPTVFNVSTAEYTITEEGTYTITVSLDIIQVTGSDFLLLQLRENNVTQATSPVGGADTATGTYTMQFSRTYTSGDLGKKITFHLFGSGGGGQGTISNSRALFNQVITTPLIAFTHLESLSAHAPDIQFSKLFSAICAAFQLAHVIDHDQKVIHLNFKKNATAPTHTLSLEGAGLLPIRQNITEPEGYSFKWANDADDELLQDRAVLNTLLLEPNKLPTVVRSLPEGISVTDLSPDIELLERTVLSHANYPGTPVTLQVRARGASLPLELDMPTDPLRLGLFLGNVSDLCLAAHEDDNINLSVRNNNFSITGLVMPWLDFLNTNTREFEFELLPSHPAIYQLTADSHIYVYNNVFLVKEIRHTTTASGALQVLRIKAHKL
jgi:hypothetical protein